MDEEAVKVEERRKQVIDLTRQQEEKEKLELEVKAKQPEPKSGEKKGWLR